MLACDVGDEAAVRAAFDAAERRGKVTDVVHGHGHRFSPSEINYRANIYALKAIGVRRVISVSAVGSMPALKEIRANAWSCKRSAALGPVDVRWFNNKEEV